MPRADLLALTLEDLETFSNRGLVKRAVKELESGDLQSTVTESDAGDVTVTWSDGVRCEIAAKATLAQARCTCDATSLCRHVLRSVIAYQKHSSAAATERSSSQATAPQQDAVSDSAAPQPAAAPSTAASAPAEPWDPGAVSDAYLEEVATRNSLTRGRKLFNDGLVMELRRGLKPSSYIHDLGVLVRFLVPNDLRYARCDCGDAPPCPHAIASVLAFRSLPPGRKEGLVETARRSDVTHEALTGAETAIAELLELGFSAAPQPLLDRLRRLEEALQEAGFVWPASLLHEVLLEHERYVQQDARFDAANVAELLGEFIVRLDALKSPSCTLPPLFVGGSRRDKPAAIDAARLIGIGCEARSVRGGVRLVAYLQDSDSGQVVAMEDFYPDPKPGEKQELRSFAQLGEVVFTRGQSLAAIGAGQFLMKGGWRTPSGIITPGRAKLTAYPQTNQWESLRAPLLCEGFAEVHSHLATQPPSCLRPRRLGSSLFVVPLGPLENATFNSSDQMLLATLTDLAGEKAILRFPFFSRGRAGFAALEAALQPDAKLLFLAGHVALEGPRLVWDPISLVLQEGPSRRLLQPWVEPVGTAPVREQGESRGPSVLHHPDRFFGKELLVAAGELLVLGLARADNTAARRWQGLVQQGGSSGLQRFLEAPAALRDALSQKSATTRWQPAAAIIALMTTLAQARLALDFPPPH